MFTRFFGRKGLSIGVWLAGAVQSPITGSYDGTANARFEGAPGVVASCDDGAAAAGAIAPFSFMADRMKARLFIPGAKLGSWEQSIKDPNSGAKDDTESTVEALVGTRQDFHIYHIDTETDWTDFQALLPFASAAGIEIFAAMDAPNVTQWDSRWFDSDGDGVIGDTPPVDDCNSLGSGTAVWRCQREFIHIWLEAWVRAARELSLLSASYPDTLVGFVINDFMLFVEHPAFPQCVDGKRLSIAEIGRIHDACHQHPDSTLGFFPAITFPDIGKFISPGYMLGTNYGVRMSDTDTMTVRFRVSLLPDPLVARLSFFHVANSEDTELYRSVWVAKGGTAPVEQWRNVMYRTDPDPALAEVEYTQIEFDLDSGNNVVELKLYAEPAGGLTRGCGGSGDFWHVWGAKLEYRADWNDGMAHFVVPLNARFETAADPDAYAAQGTCVGAWWDEVTTYQNDNCRCHVAGACTPLLPDNPIGGRLARWLVSAPNTAYLIQDVIDGIVPYVSNTDRHGDADALDPNLHYGRLLDQTKADLGDDLLVAIHTAFPGVEADVHMLMHRIYVAAGKADLAGVYRFPLSMHFMDPADRRGIFAQSPILGDSSERRGSLSGELAQLMAQWPTDQATLPGWYQRWTHTPPGGTAVDMRIELWDQRDASSGNVGKLFKSVAGGGLAAPTEVDVYADDHDSEYVPSDVDWLSSDSTDPAVLEMSAKGGVSIFTWVYFRATDSSGAEIDPLDWTFESGVSDPHTIEVYERLTELFKRIKGP